jgi:hypothetical protein
MKVTQKRLEEILREEIAAVTEGAAAAKPAAKKGKLTYFDGMVGGTLGTLAAQNVDKIQAFAQKLGGAVDKITDPEVLNQIMQVVQQLTITEGELEEVWGKQKPFGEDPKDRKPKVDPWATAHKRGGPGGSVHRAGPAKLGPERPMTPKSAEQHAKDIEHGSREYDATRRLPEELSEMFGASDVGSFDDQKEKLTRIIKNYLETIYQEYMDDMTGDPTSHEENKRAAMSAAKGDLAAEIDEIIKDVNSFLGEARRKRETPAQKRRRSEEERRNAELRSQGKPEWQSGQPGVTTTSPKDLKKMMQND